MSIYKGTDGGFLVGSTLTTFIDHWSLKRGLATEETTYFGEEWEVHEGTVKNWSVEISGSLDRSDAQQAALLEQLEDAAITKVGVRLQIAASTYWQGSALVTGDGIDNSAKGKVNYATTLKGSGPLVFNG